MKRGFRLNATERQLFILAAAVLLFRIFYVDIYRELQVEHGFDLYKSFADIFSHYAVFIPVSVADILFVIYFSRRYPYGKKPLRRFALIFGYIIVVSGITSALVNSLEADHYVRGQMLLYFLIRFLAALLINAAIVVIGDLINYYQYTHRALVTEIGKKHKAQYQYNRLKQQLNPHFLFNSLNNLDYLVQTDPVRASDFIKKLAGIYRYMLGNEDKPVVSLRDELIFTDLYLDLLKERFQDGLAVITEIPEQYLDYPVIPCSVQILIENATKHNIVGSEMPLEIRIRIEGGKLVVSNNLQPRLTPSATTGKGLKNIDGQYRDVMGRSITIDNNGKNFTVSLPLI